ncbi:MAG: hypothetical protein JWN76_1595 [Chitinophagaceae bacterium]|nr:hypothetical protein [Chitinophagaceae bacterium]
MKTVLTLIATILLTSLSFNTSGKHARINRFVNLSITSASNYNFEVYKSVSANISVELVEKDGNNTTIIWKKQLGQYTLYNTNSKKNEQTLSLKGVDTKNMYLVYTITYTDENSGSQFKKQLAANLDEKMDFNIAL